MNMNEHTDLLSAQLAILIEIDKKSHKFCFYCDGYGDLDDCSICNHCNGRGYTKVNQE